jgi:hypothetical protein
VDVVVAPPFLHLSKVSTHSLFGFFSSSNIHINALHPRCILDWL